MTTKYEFKFISFLILIFFYFAFLFRSKPFSIGLVVGRLNKRFSLPDLPLDSLDLSTFWEKKKIKKMVNFESNCRLWKND